MREQILKAMEECKFVAILRGIDREVLIPLAEAMYNGGIRLLEITYNAEGNPSDDVTASNIKLLAEHFKGRMYIGAGTVLTEKQVELTKKAGGGFIISPDTYESVIRKTRELDMVSIPGAFTPSEIQAAHRYGADFVKLFPIGPLGISYFKFVKAPLSHIKMLAVAGVDESNIRDYLDAGIAGFGMGANIIDKRAIEEGNFEVITTLARKYTQAIEDWKKSI